MARSRSYRLDIDSAARKNPAPEQSRPAVRFFTDQAIQRHEQDELQIQDFVNRLVSPLVEWPNDQSLVVGLYGPWGSGKTSILNLLEDALISASDNTPAKVVRFTPWLYSSTEALLQSFFETLTEATRSIPQLSQEQQISLATALDAIGKFVGPVFGTITSLYTGGLDLVGPGVAALNTASQTFLKGGEISFDKHKKRAASELRALGTAHKRSRLVVLIDDLDRAEAPEVLAMLKLVRLIADLPNITYVLAIDYVRIQRLLASESDAFGANYLEKIIQIPISLPPLSTQRLTALLQEGVDTLLHSAGHVGTLISERFRIRNLDFETALLWRIRTLRDRARVLNSLRFLLLSGNTRLDVDPVDALLISTLQTFYPEILERVRNNREFLTSPGTMLATVRRIRGNNENRLQIRKRALESIITGGITPGLETNADDEAIGHAADEGNLFTGAGGAAASKQELLSLKRILTALFPNALKGEASVPDAKLLRKENRIGVAERFDRYFTLGAPDEVGDTFVTVWLETTLDLLASTADNLEISARTAFAEVDQLSSTRRVSFVEKIMDRLDDVPLHFYPKLAHALAIAGAENKLGTEEAAKLIKHILLITEHRRTTEYEEAKQAGRLRILAEVTEAYEVLLRRMRDPTDAAIAAGHHVLSWRRRAERSTYHAPSPLDAALTRITEAGLVRMQDFLSGGGNLFELAEFRIGEAVWRWRDLLRDSNREYTPIKDYLKEALRREPQRLPASLGMFAGWSGEHPSLTYRGIYNDLRASADEVIGWTTLLRCVIQYRKSNYEPDPVHEHLVGEFQAIVATECANRRAHSASGKSA